MNALLFSISAAALLSLTSLLTVVFRVSPLTAPGQAIPAFLVSIFLSAWSVSTLLAYAIWRRCKREHWDDGRVLRVALREGSFFAFGTLLVFGLLLLDILSWWTGALLYGVFILVEVALLL